MRSRMCDLVECVLDIKVSSTGSSKPVKQEIHASRLVLHLSRANLIILQYYVVHWEPKWSLLRAKNGSKSTAPLLVYTS